MGYSITKKLSELGASRMALEAKLSKAAAQFLKRFDSFDQCAVYLLNEEDGAFELKGAAGSKKALPGSYAMGAGIAGLVMKKKGILEARVPQGGGSFKGVHDPGLAGFRTVLAGPLKAGEKCLGVFYLKAFGDASTGAGEKEFADGAAAQLAMLVEFDRLKRSFLESCHETEELRQRLGNVEKFMVLGDMAAMLAHEIKNPLVSVGGFARRLKRHIKPGAPGFTYVEQMVSEITRLEKIVAGAMRVTREELPELRSLDMNEVLKEVLSVFAEEVETHGIRVERDFCRGKLQVMADREQLKIAFDNLIANAIQSMDKGGTLKLTTARKQGWVSASVADTGGGIDPSIADYIFNPFFTTKKNGTGLGLTITNSIIMRHKGTIDIDNRAGRGVTFTVKLPLAG